MGTFTSKATGNWSASGQTTWNETGVPGDGDTVTIAAGHTITVDTNTTVGATSGSYDGVLIQGTDATTYGKLIVPDGVTLTLKGVYSWVRFALKVQRYAQFVCQPGSTVIVACTADYQTGIKCDGILDAQGTLAKPITFTVPSLPASWSGATTDVASETKSGTGDEYLPNVKVRALDNPFITNAGKTALGSSASTSFSCTSSTPSGLCVTPVASLALVNGVGKFYLDHDAGIIYYYDPDGASSITYSYTHLTMSAAAWRGWGIWITNNNSYCWGKFDHCVFEYMGGVSDYVTDTATFQGALLLSYRHSEAVSANRSSFVKNSTFRYNSGCDIEIIGCTGTAADPVLITGNTFNNDKTGGRYHNGIVVRNPSAYTPDITTRNDYLKFDGNTINKRGPWVYIERGGDGIRLTNNTGRVGTEFYYGLYPKGYGLSAGDEILTRSSTPDLYIAGNTINGVGSVLDGRLLRGVGGTSGHPAICESNTFGNMNRLGTQTVGFTTYRKNIVYNVAHHGMTGSIDDEIHISDILWENNLFVGYSNASFVAIALGYNHRSSISNVTIRNNTMYGGQALVDLGDLNDTTSSRVRSSNVSITNNLVVGATYFVQRDTESEAGRGKAHVLEIDYNLGHDLVTAYGAQMNNNANAQNFWSGATKYNRLTPKNIPFAALYDGNYTTAQTAKSLVHTVNTAGEDQTLAWGGGTPVQIITDYGTSAGAGRRTLACIGKTFVANTVGGRWLVILSGTGAGQVATITNVTAKTLYAASVNAAGSGYSSGEYVYVDNNGGTYPAILKITGVDGSGAVTSFEIVSGGIITTPITSAAPTYRMTTADGSGLTVDGTYGPGVMFGPDFSTALDDTSVFAIVESEVTLADSDTKAVRCGIDGTLFSTTGGTDAGITVTVDKSLTSDPALAGSSFPSITPADYKIGAASPAKDAGTTDSYASDDYWATPRTNPDIGFNEVLASGGALGPMLMRVWGWG